MQKFQQYYQEREQKVQMEDKNSFGNHLSLESVKVIAESIGIGK